MKTIKTESINYHKLKCPICNTTGKYKRDNQENLYCTECGLVIDSPYPYVAGIRFKTLSTIIRSNEDGNK